MKRVLSLVIRVINVEPLVFWDDTELFDLSLPTTALVVRLYLASVACRDRHTIPSLGVIAQKTGLSKSSVQKALDTLVARNLITRHNPDGGIGTDQYKLNRVSFITNPVKCDSSQNGICEEEVPHELPRDVINCAMYWEQLTTVAMNSLSIEVLQTFLDDGITTDLVRTVMKDNVANGKTSVQYLWGCLRNCLRGKTFTVETWRAKNEEVRQAREAYLNRKDKQRKQELLNDEDEKMKLVDEIYAELEGGEDPD